MARRKGLLVVPGLTASRICPPGLKPCPMVLVFGCRQSRIDHIYKEETLFAKTQGVFRELYTAYSREPDKPKVRGRHCSSPGVQPRAAVASRHGVEMLVPWHSHGSSCPGALWLHKCAGSRPSQCSPIPRAHPHPCASLNACPHCSCFALGGCSRPHEAGADEEGKGTWARRDVTWWGGPEPVQTSGPNSHHHLSRPGDEIYGEGARMQEQNNALLLTPSLFYRCGCCKVQACSPKEVVALRRCLEGSWCTQSWPERAGG